MFGKETKILVVDDMSTMRKLVTKHLKDLGFENITASDDGANAWIEIEKASKAGQAFELVLCDWNMPRMNGLELLQKVRGTKAIKDTLFIMLTAESETHQVDKANLLKVNGYIKKPFTSGVLIQKLEAVFQKKAA